MNQLGNRLVLIVPAAYTFNKIIFKEFNGLIVVDSRQRKKNEFGVKFLVRCKTTVLKTLNLLDSEQGYNPQNSLKLYVIANQT